MTQLMRLARDGHTEVIKEKLRYLSKFFFKEFLRIHYICCYRDVLRLLLENLSDQVGSTRALVFGALTEMLKQESLISSFHGFCELIILKVLEAHRDEEKDVSLIISIVFLYSRQIDHFWPICKRSSLRSQLVLITTLRVAML